ncbi:MAG TPA: hypothetical protein VL371_03540 [Gemmataceae bacterium]|jgi:hypothetical protein|nr:hypothetical protein [Gemmataceae bacterium]
MRDPGAIFFDFSLPNATTWAVLSALMAVALFFKFNRILSVRNWDLVSLFLLVPGLLLLQEGRALWIGYLWLMAGGAYFFLRCLLDLALVRRPALAPNLNFAGMAWLTGTLFVSFGGVAVSRSAQQDLPIGKRSAVLEEAQSLATAIVEQTAGPPPGEHTTRFWVERGLAGTCHLAVILALIVIGWRHFQDATAGMAAATLYLLAPYTSFYLTQIDHVLPAALLLWAIAAYNRPTVAGLLVGLAAGSFFPLLTLPVWLSFYWGRGARRFACGFAATAVLSLSITGAILWLDGQLASRLQQTLSLSDWQPWLVPTGESFWSGVHWAYRIPVFVGYAAFVLITAIWPRPKDLSHLISLTAAVLIGIQFWYADQGGVYVLWYLPLLLLLMFRPNLSDRLPPAIQGDDLLARTGRRLVALAGRLMWRPRPLVPLG